MRIQPYDPPEEPPEPVVAEPQPIDVPGVTGRSETAVKRVLCRLIDMVIEWLLGVKARLRAPQKMELPEIEEEDK